MSTLLQSWHALVQQTLCKRLLHLVKSNAMLLMHFIHVTVSGGCLQLLGRRGGQERRWA